LAEDNKLQKPRSGDAPPQSVQIPIRQQSNGNADAGNASVVAIK
jgi:hypothetical protein